MQGIQANYYQPTFERLHHTYSALLDHNLHELPKALRARSVLQRVGAGQRIKPDDARDALTPVLGDIEQQLSRIASRHSCFYWIHLYRRLGVVLSHRHGDNTGPMTLSWVRAIAEQAIFKYGRLHGRADVGIANRVGAARILGGEFLKSVARWPHIFHELGREAYVTSIVTSPEWVLTDFRPTDLAHIYQIEGLAFEYWYVNAKQRAAGKGIEIEVTVDGTLRELRSEEQEMLIVDFDRRIDEFGEGLPTNVGTFVPQREFNLEGTLLFFQRNVERDPLPKFLGEAVDPFTKQPLIPNFLPIPINIARYYKEHSYLEKAFQVRHGFGLKEFCVAALAISALLFTRHAGQHLERFGQQDDGDVLGLIMNPLMRGYLSPTVAAKFEGDLLEILSNLELAAELKNSSIKEQLPAIVSYLSLDAQKQANVGIWSLGPRYVAIPFGDFVFYDMSAWLETFRKLFFGLRKYDPKGEKGPRFEAVVAGMARQKGLEVVFESFELKIAGSIRECDVGIRAGTHLYVCECRASERPLDFDIGNRKTINARSADLSEKVDQVMSLSELLRQHPLGANYDVSWATQVTGLVISPFTEWVWELSDRLFLSRKPLRPRIMSAPEALNFIAAENEAI